VSKRVLPQLLMNLYELGCFKCFFRSTQWSATVK